MYERGERIAIVLGSHKLVHVNDSEFFILFQSYLKDFPKASPRE